MNATSDIGARLSGSSGIACRTGFRIDVTIIKGNCNIREVYGNINIMINQSDGFYKRFRNLMSIRLPGSRDRSSPERGSSALEAWPTSEPEPHVDNRRQT